MSQLPSSINTAIAMQWVRMTLSCGLYSGWPRCPRCHERGTPCFKQLHGGFIWTCAKCSQGRCAGEELSTFSTPPQSHFLVCPWCYSAPSIICGRCQGRGWIRL